MLGSQSFDWLCEQGHDAAYRTKYGRYAASLIDPMTSSEARAARLKLVPR